MRFYAWVCQRLYHEFAWAYDLVAWLVSLGQWATWRRLALDELPGDKGRVLELGFGTGALLAEIAQSGRSVVGLDASWPMQRIATRRLASLGPSAPRVQGIGQQLPFSDGAFSALVSTFPAAYILAPETLAECRRVLQPEGCLIIVGLWTTPVSPALRGLLPFFFGSPSPSLVLSMRKTLADAGFAEVRVENRTTGWVSVGTVVATRRAW